MYPANEEIYSACSIPLRFIRMRTRSQASNQKMSRYDGFGCSVDKTRVCFLFFSFFISFFSSSSFSHPLYLSQHFICFFLPLFLGTRPM